MIIETILVPEKQIYANGDFRIYACSTDDPSIQLNNYGNCSIKGTVQRLDIGVPHKASLELAEINPKFGASYNCISIYQDIPETTEGQKDYLATIMTDLQLKAITDYYGEDTDIIELIKNKTFDYTKVYGFGPVVFERIYQKVMETLEYKEILSKFGKYGITYETILKLAEELEGSRQLAVQKLEEDPYVLCKYVIGWGFKRTDIVAKKMGVKHEDPRRIREGIKYTIEKNQEQGHTWMSRKDLLISACDILQLSENQIECEIENTDGLKIIPGEVEDRIALQGTYNAEYNIAKRLKELLANNIELEFDVEDFINRMEKKYGFVLTEQQRGFFFNIKRSSVNLLVGYGGCGKSMLQKLLIDLLEELKITYLALAPTGKAGKVLQSYIGRPVSTIHRAIGYGKDKKERHLISIHQEFILVDEWSMSDSVLASMLLSKITNPMARILFIGDAAQIPSVQCGNVLHDMIESKVIPTTMLDIVFRQKEGGVLDIATRVRQGQSFIPYNFSGKQKFGENFILHCVRTEDIPSGFKYYYKAMLQKYSPEDILVLSPKKDGELGTIKLNKYIQEEVNPASEEKKEYPIGDLRLLRVGDYIINTKNTYDMINENGYVVDIMNGDSGIIIDIITEKQTVKNNEDNKKENSNDDGTGIVVKFDDGTVRFRFSEAVQLLHGWCITYHKSQGSASKVVIIIADSSNYYNLNSNLLYVAVTRTEEKCIMLSQAIVICACVKRFENLKRNTFLKGLLIMSEDAESA